MNVEGLQIKKTSCVGEDSWQYTFLAQSDF